VNVFYAIIVSAAIGTSCAACPEDLDGNGTVDIQDVLVVWSNAGRCPAFIPAAPNVGESAFESDPLRPAAPWIPAAIPNP
jgi:hypothetical protein